MISASCQSPTLVNNTRECTELQFLRLILISRGAKTYRWKQSISTYFVQISSGYPSIYRSSLTAQGKQNVPGLCTGGSIELRAITLTKAARTTPSFTWRRPNVDFREVQVPVYINGRKSDLNRPWLERAACWKRQEVSGMLITHWNVASRALPVLALKSNYLDRWPNNWLTVPFGLPMCPLWSGLKNNFASPLLFDVLLATTWNTWQGKASLGFIMLWISLWTLLNKYLPDQHICMYNSEAAEKLLWVDQCSINGHTSQRERALWYSQSAQTALQPNLIVS